MNLNQINYFLAICKTMNFTKAAHNLYISQTAVTKQIQLLETELGTKLFNRNNKQIELTEAGRFFLIEAKNAKEFYKLNKDIVYATCPKIYTKYTTSKVLVMEYIDGVQIDKTNELINLGYDLTDIANKLCENYIKQIVDDAFFHADPHPGNIKIKGGEIVWIDLGMVGKLSNRDRGLIKNAIMAVATNDIGKLKDVVLTLGEVNGRINHSKLYEDIDIFMNKYSEVEMSDIDLGIILEEFLSIANRHNIGIPKGITMLGRGLITIQGVVSILAPQINIIDIVSNHVASEVFKEFDL